MSKKTDIYRGKSIHVPDPHASKATGICPNCGRPTHKEASSKSKTGWRCPWCHAEMK